MLLTPIKTHPSAHADVQVEYRTTAAASLSLKSKNNAIYRKTVCTVLEFEVKNEV